MIAKLLTFRTASCLAETLIALTCACEFRKKRLTLWRTREEYTTSTKAAEPGNILAMDETGIVAACAGSTGLRIEEVQIEGKRRVTLEKSQAPN